MVYIDVLNKKKDLKVKLCKESSDFFFHFFHAIDTEELACLYLMINNHRLDLDFSYDFLSIYDFLQNLIEFLNSDILNQEFVLLLYERGDDKLIFQNIKNNNVKVLLINNGDKFESIFNSRDLKKIFIDLINKINDIGSYFNLTPLNKNHLDKWKNEIVLTL